MHKFISPKNIYHGKGALNELSQIINDLKVEKVFVISDPNISELGVINPVLNALNNSNVQYTVSTNVTSEPSLKVGNEIVEEARVFTPDLVIGIGGGSALDLTKATAVLVTNNGKIEDYLNLSGIKELKNKGIPKVLIPTTAGTGSEVTDIAVFTLEDTKDVITHEYLLADYAIVDYTLTLTLPAKQTASSGIDAFTHAVEAYTSIYATPITEMYSLNAIKKIYENIRTAVWNGKDEQAREQMALGSLFAALSFYNAGVAGVHGLAYPLGGLYKIPHGESNAVLLPYVYDNIWPSCIKKICTIAKVIGLPTEGKSDREIAISVVKSFKDLVKDVGLPSTLADYNIQEKDLDHLAENAIKQARLISRSPKPLTINEVKNIYYNAYKGIITNQ